MKKTATFAVAIATIVLAIVSGAVIFTRPVPIITTTIDADYIGQNALLLLNKDEYERLKSEQKSFIILTHQPGCAAQILTYMSDYAVNKNLTYYYFKWSDLRDTDLKKIVGFPPSVIIIKNGEPVAHLDANSNNDIEFYNDYAKFSAWLDARLELN